MGGKIELGGPRGARARWQKSIHFIREGGRIKLSDSAPIFDKAFALADRRGPCSPMTVELLFVVEAHAKLIMHVFPIAEQRV